MKKLYAILLSVCLMAATFAGCGASAPSDSGAAPAASTAGEPAAADDTQNSGEEPSTVTMWTFLDPTNTTNGRSTALVKMIDMFEAEHPGASVVVEPQDYMTMSAKFLAATSTNGAPDIIWCARDELPGILDAGALVPLEDLFLGDWSAEEIEDISDSFFDYGERDGKHYTLSLSKNAVLLYYREDLLEKNGLEVPTTWDAFVNAATLMTGQDEETGINRYGLGQSFSIEVSDSQLLSNRILEKQSLFNEDGTANWTNDVALEALNWTVDSIRKTGITPEEAVNTSGEDLFLEFQSGKYGMIVGGAVRCAAVKQGSTFNGDFVQLAALPGEIPTVLDGWFVGVWSGSENKELAGEFLETMYSPEADVLWVQEGGQAPVRKSTLETLDAFINTDANRYLSVLTESFQDGWFPDNSMSYNAWKFDLNQAVQNVLVDGMDPAESLEATATAFNARNGR